MKKTIILLIITILFSCSENSTNNENNNNINDYYVKISVYIIYNNQKRLKREIYFDGKASPIPTMRRFFECYGKDFKKYEIDISHNDDLDDPSLYYDKFGSIIKCNFYQWQGIPDSVVRILQTRIFFYNSSGYLYTIKLLVGNDTVGYWNIKSIDGKIQEIDGNLSDFKGKIKYEYNSNGYISKEITYSYNNPDLKDTNEFKQNTNGYLIEKKEKKYDIDYVEIDKYTYQYDEKGRPLKMLHYDDKDSLIYTFNYKYENNFLKQRGNVNYIYDNNNNLIQSDEGGYKYIYEYYFNK